MVAVSINLHVELFAELYQLFGIFGTVLEMHIVVRHAVYQQQVAVQLVGTGKGGTGLIAFGVFFRCTHEAFAVDGVVVVPVGNGGYGYPCLEYRSPFTHAHNGHVSAVAPSPDADAVFVHVWLAAHVEGGFHLVSGFLDTQVQIGAFGEFGTTSSGTTPVYANHDIAL